MVVAHTDRDPAKSAPGHSNGPIGDHYTATYSRSVTGSPSVPAELVSKRFTKTDDSYYRFDSDKEHIDKKS